MHTDVVVIGGGIVGLATARALLLEGITDAVLVLEKEAGLAAHQSTHNSGVLHAGLQYQPGSEKARLAREGIRAMTEYCAHHGIAHEVCGKLVVATDPAEFPRLEEMLARGRANGLAGLRRMVPEEVREREPHVRAAGAILVPEEGIVDYGAVCATMAGEIRAAGGVIRTAAPVRGIVREGGGAGPAGRWLVLTAAGEFTARVLVNCAGLHVDRVARMAGERPPAHILPFRGEYRKLRPARAHLVRHLVYPLPEPGFPFLGVHFTRRVDGSVDAGPNAVLAFAREGYRLTRVNPRDLLEALVYPGLWRFLVKHPRMVRRELLQSAAPWRFVRALQRLVPEVEGGDLVPGGSGVRAQAVLPSGEFVHDFLWMERPGAVHVVNAPSPAATASLVIGREIARRAGRALAGTGVA
ncbi:MAG TPA: L-2-hydroxyglutarate oxidase [Longimicrobiales bacterium]|nr:L-2-hydroxyglutarate oxidase [Longimicrobiales bacterium]